MNVTNILLTFVVLILAGAVIKYQIEKKKNAPTEETLDVDDKALLHPVSI